MAALTDAMAMSRAVRASVVHRICETPTRASGSSSKSVLWALVFGEIESLMNAPASIACEPSRQELLDRLSSTASFDVIVIGGGATGLGIAVDAAARGFSTALFEAEDFAKGLLGLW